jgi:osmotically-inducible protein OsmY
MTDATEFIEPTARPARTGIARAASIGAILGLTVLVSGCAVGLLRGAASSGGASSTGSTTTSQGSGTASRQAADNAISTSVRSKLAANAVTKPFNLLVDTHDGVVTLRGQVTKVETRTAAEAQARSVTGVKGVQNLITVR